MYMFIRLPSPAELSEMYSGRGRGIVPLYLHITALVPEDTTFYMLR